MAEVDKRRKHADIDQHEHGELLTLACEIGGRWNDTATELIYKLAAHKAQSSPQVLRRSVELAWADRWFAMIAVAVQDALAASLIAPSGRRLVLDHGADAAPSLEDLLDRQRWALETDSPAFD